MRPRLLILFVLPIHSLCIDCTTFGGFIWGWTRDLWRLPSYVAFYNRDYGLMERVRLEYRLRPKRPAMNMTALFVQLVVGLLYGELLSQTFNLLAPVPESSFPSLYDLGWSRWSTQMLNYGRLLRLLSIILRGTGVAVGVWLVGNASRLQYARFMPVWGAAVCGQLWASTFMAKASPITLIDDGDSDLEMLTKSDVSLLSIAFAMMTYVSAHVWSHDAVEMINSDPIRMRSEKDTVATTAPKRQSRGRCFRMIRFSTFMWLYMLILGNWFLHIEIEDVPLKVSLNNLRNDPSTIEFFTNLHQQWEAIRENGWNNWWEDVKETFDLGGHQTAYQTLGLDPNKGDSYSLNDLRKARNKLALKYHPDKADTEGLSTAEREAKFNEIQRAYEKLVKLRQEAESESTSHSSRRRQRHNSGRDSHEARRSSGAESTTQGASRSNGHSYREEHQRKLKEERERKDRQRREQERKDRQREKEERERKEKEKKVKEREQKEKELKERQRKEKEREEKLRRETERKKQQQRQADESSSPSPSSDDLTSAESLAQARAAGSEAGRRYREAIKAKYGKDTRVEDYPVPRNFRKVTETKQATDNRGTA